MLVSRIKKLDNIDPKTWEHPADKAALAALHQLKGLDELIKNFLSVTQERSLYLTYLASSVKVTETQFPKIHRMITEIVETFDWPYTPPVFISQDPRFNAYVLGVKEPFIVLNNSIAKTLDDEELKAIIGHEMGHLMSGHALYKTLIWFIVQLSLGMIPIAELLLIPIKMALFEWDRKSELTADRAGLLAIQNETPSYNVLMRMAGGDDLTQVNINEFFNQAKEYEDRKDLLDSVHKLLNQVTLTHPQAVIRLQELRAWTGSGHYQAILDGIYKQRRKPEPEAEDTTADDIKGGFEYYKSSIHNSDDPVSKLFASIGDGIEKATGDFNETLKNILGDKKPKE